MIDEQGKKNLIKASYIGDKKQIKHEKRVRKQKTWRTLVEQIKRSKAFFTIVFANDHNHCPLPYHSTVATLQ